MPDNLKSMNLLFGAHMSIAKGFAAAAAKIADEYGANALQFFVKNPRGRQSKKLTKKEAEEFHRTCKEKNIKFIVAHASYLVNLSKKASEVKWLIDDVVGDFERVHMLGGNGVVVHLGKASGGMSKEEAIKNMIENIEEILKKTAHTKLKFILENTAGQKSDLGYQFEELAEIWKKIKPLSSETKTRMKICLDTQHSWAAGYDWENTKGVLKEFDQYIGIKNIACIHFNDSKKPLGSRVDRHENLFTGLIGEKNLIKIAKFAQKKDIPIILETPGDQNGDHHAEMKKLKMLIGSMGSKTPHGFHEIEVGKK